MPAAERSGERLRPTKLRLPTCDAMPRHRLDAILDQLWQHGFGVVVAPAGSGKTTLLSQFAASVHCPAATYRVGHEDGTEAAFLAHLERACVDALDVAGGWQGAGDAAAQLEAWGGERAVLIVDDLHTVEGTPAEGLLERLLDDLPPSIAVLAATRRPPQFDLSRRRLSGRLLELDADLLRFRYWEVEELFREFYREPLPPEDLAQLARCTGGWAAGLQLFHLATTGKQPADRQRFLSGLGTRSRLVREYLTRNLLDELPQVLRRFLLRTCVLDRLTARRCDVLLDTTDSGGLLRELERRQIVTFAIADDSYRYHEVLRGHLEGALFEELGERDAKALYRRAGDVLETEGDASEALRAYCRAEDWAAASGVLGRDGEKVAADPGAWVEQLPPAVVEGDPWLLLALARRYLAAGRCNAAADAFARAEWAFGPAAGAGLSRRERAALSAWTQPSMAPPPGWTGLVLAALRRDPAAGWPRAASLGDPVGLVAAGLCAQLAGRRRDAERLLRTAAENPGASPTVITAARLMAQVPLAETITGEAKPSLDVVLEATEAASPWMARLAGAVLAITDRPDGVAEARAAGRSCEREGDRWGAAVAALLEGLGLLRRGEPSRAALEDATERFRSLGAATCEAWCRSATAVAAAHGADADAQEVAVAAETFARLAAVRGAQVVALGALSTSGTDGSPIGLAAAAHDPRPDALMAGNGNGDRDRTPSLVVRCFGGFEMLVDGRKADLSAVKPKARVILRMLALAAGRPVHREQIVDALWPDLPTRGGCHNLHVAISSLRQALEPGVQRGETMLLTRDGDAYRLSLPDDADVDVLRFERAVADARAARVAGDDDAAVDALDQALLAYTGQLLPEDGPAEWAVHERERLSQEASNAAQALADLKMARGQPERAVAACEQGLRIDPYRDALWRRLVEAHVLSGDLAGAERASRAYQATLAELGVAPDR